MTKPKKREPETEPCWYCRHKSAVLWCDFMLGGVEGPPEQVPLLVDMDQVLPVLGGPFMTGQEMGRLHFDLRMLSPIATCDAAACHACAERFRWRNVTHFADETVDHCPHHAKSRSTFGNSLFIGSSAASVLRSDVRAMCARATFTVSGVR